MSTNPLLQTLKIIDTLNQQGACTAATLQTMWNISPSTLKRCIFESRELSADICSVRMNRGWVYELRNADSVMTRVKQWIDLEEKRNLTL